MPHQRCARLTALVDIPRSQSRAPQAEDGRAIVLTVTPAGRRLCDRIRADLIAEAKQLLEDFEPEVREGAARLILRSARAAAVRSGVARGSGCCPPPGCK